MSGEKILVVEDSVTTATKIKKTLEKMGYDVAAIVDSGEESIKKAYMVKPDLVLMDIVLKGTMTGIEAAQVIRDNLKIPVIFLTAHSDDVLLEKAVTAGPSGYLLKPLDEKVLKVTIQVALYKHATEQKLQNSENKRNAIIRSSPVPQFVIDPDHNVVNWNVALEKYSGIKADEVLGTNQHWRAFYPQERPCLADLVIDGAVGAVPHWYPGKYAKSHMIGDAYEATDFFPRMNGSGIWLHFTAALIRDADDRVIGAVETLEDITERKRTEEELLVHQAELETQAEELRRAYAAVGESRDKYLDLYDFAPAGYLTLSEKALVTGANLSAAALLGVTRRKLVTSRFSTFIAEQDADQWYRYFANVLSADEKQACTLVLRRKDGSTFPAQLEGVRLTDGVDGTRTVRVAVSDITDIRQAEQELLNSERKCQGVLDHTSEFIGLMKTDGTLIMANHAALECCGAKESDLLGKPFWDTPWWSHSKELQDRLRAAVLQAASGGFEGFEATHLAADGSLVYVDFSLNPVRDEQGTVLFLVPEGRDITMRKLAEETLAAKARQLEGMNQELAATEQELRATVEELQQSGCKIRESEEKYRTLAESSPDSIFIIGRDDTVQFVNSHAAGLLHLPAAEIIGKPRRNFFPADIVDRQGKGLQTVFETGEPYRSEDKVLYGNEEFWQDNALVPIRDESGNVTAVLGVARDITERRRADELVKVLARMSDDAPASITVHDFEGHNLYVNEETLRLHGYTRLEYLEKTLHEIDVPDSEQLFAEHMNHILSTGEGDFEVQHFRKDGTIFPLRVKVKIIDWGGRKVLMSIATDITERKLAQEALMESRERYRTLFETMIQGVVYQDSKGHITHANPAAERILGLSFDQMQSSTSIDPRWKVVHADGSNFPHNSHPAIEALSTGKEVRDVIMGVYNPVKNGFTWISVNAVPQFQKGETRPFQVYTTFEDITGRKWAEEQLRETNEYLNNLFDYANAPIIVWDPQGRITRFNHAFENLTGLAEQDVLGQPLAVLFPEKSRYTSLELIKTTTGGEHWETVKIPVLAEDGRVLTVLWNSANIKGADGELVSTIAQGVDITEREHAEAALRDSERTIRNLLNAVPDDLALINHEKKIIAINSSMAETLGQEPEALAGREIGDLIPSPVLADTLDRVMGPAMTGGQIYFEEKRNGRWLETLVYPVTDRTATATRIAIQSRDITHRKQIEEELKRAGLSQVELNIEKFQILNDQIRNPLQVIRGYLALDPADYPDEINKQVTIIDNLVTQLDMGWLESEKVQQFLLKHSHYPMQPSRETRQAGGLK